MITFQYDNGIYPENKEEQEEYILKMYKEVDDQYPKGEIMFFWNGEKWIISSSQNNLYHILSVKDNKGI